MLQTAAVVSSPVMTGYKTGAETRRAILLALLEREPRTMRGLAAATDRTHANIQAHLARMERSGLVTIERGQGRRGAQVRLTEAGRLAAQTV